jgi:hypothetical protein
MVICTIHSIISLIPERYESELFCLARLSHLAEIVDYRLGYETEKMSCKVLSTEILKLKRKGLGSS